VDQRRGLGRTAEIREQYLHKGSLVYLDWPLKIDRYDDKRGATHYFTKVVALQRLMLDKKSAEDPVRALEEERADYIA
jgi:single-stranded DNA-binding protein